MIKDKIKVRAQGGGNLTMKNLLLLRKVVKKHLVIHLNQVKVKVTDLSLPVHLQVALNPRLFQSLRVVESLVIALHTIIMIEAGMSVVISAIGVEEAQTQSEPNGGLVKILICVPIMCQNDHQSPLVLMVGGTEKEYITAVQVQDVTTTAGVGINYIVFGVQS